MQNISFPKVVIFGASGFIGSYFLDTYRKLYPDCVAVSPRSNDFPYNFNLKHPDISGFKLKETGHSVALLLMGITKISECEKEPTQTRSINVSGILTLIRQLVEANILPVFFSSDHVFSGKKGLYNDDDPFDPVSEYGKQKAEVESLLPEITGGNHLIIRLSKTYSMRKGDGSLFDEIASKLVSGTYYPAAYDQIFSPIFVGDVVSATSLLLSNREKGTFNVCGITPWSRYDLAMTIAEELGNKELVQRISLDELAGGVVNPKNTSMMPEKLIGRGFAFTSLEESIKHIVSLWRE